MDANTKVLVVETNPHNQTSKAWTGATTVGEVIVLVDVMTANKVTQPIDFLLANAGINMSLFNDSEGDFDATAFDNFVAQQPIKAHFQAAIDCAASDGHVISTYWSAQEALDDGAPRYMSEDAFATAIGLAFPL